MKIKISEIVVRNALTKTGIPGRKYCLNPYVGCAHACKYCYATFMKRFTGHIEPWGSFVDIKINTPEALRKQLGRAEKGNIIVSSVTDPYQPIEAKYKITRKCLEVLALNQFPIDILTKSPLVLRDIDIISKIKKVKVGLTITTDNDKARKIFEPKAPPISARIEALEKLYKAGINTYVFIGPILPMNPEAFARQIKPYVNGVLIDKMNYTNKTKWLYRKHRIEKWIDEDFMGKFISRLERGFSTSILNHLYY